ncbi:Gfo/Idh/MocA family protein [Microbacterium thalli]|uniref:Gfo/Idh/MocA family protein n=1 Tax=Microbacterium thalli TaxID=3027921 RepID=UPI00236618A0|nr:Gfo/Idh/MocA family oxidoreductase [Microbacterium thalli]MDD7928779.1 Gfo/Idh/MocA family oxidoreductase [Microbacterium thalli]
MTPVRWAILGPGQIAESFAAGLHATRSGSLAAVGSSDPARARAFADRYGAEHAGGYDDVIGHPGIDAVYVSTVHPAHRALVEAALRAGRAVLCEKPLTTSEAETRQLFAVAADAGVPLVEAYKNRFSPFARMLDDIVATGEIGAARRLSASFGFRAEERTGRLFDPALAGGALLDVGGYPLSLAVQVAAAAGIAPDELRIAEARGDIGPTGVDEHATAVVAAGDFEAHIETSIRAALPRSAKLIGSSGTLRLPDAWGSRTASAEHLLIETGGGPQTRIAAVVHPFAAEADAVAALLAGGRVEADEMPGSHSVAVARLLDDWAAALHRG